MIPLRESSLIRSFPYPVMALTFIVYAYFYNGANWNQNARLDVIYSFVEPQTPDFLSFRIDHFIYDKDAGENTGDYSYSLGHYYSNKAPGSAFFGIPIYAGLFFTERLLGYDPGTPTLALWNAYLLNLFISVFLASLATGFFFLILIRHFAYSRSDALIHAHVFAFCTLLFPFSTSFWFHSTTASLLLIGFYFLLTENFLAILLGGVLWGLAFSGEYLAGLYLPLGLLLLSSGKDKIKKWLFYMAGYTPSLLFILIYHKLCFGSYMTPASAKAQALFLDSSLFLGQFHQVSFSSLVKLLFSIKRGLFIYCPVFLLVPLCGLRMIRVQTLRLKLFLVSGILLPLLVVSSYRYWDAGSSTGARYLIMSLPFWCLLLPPFGQLGKWGKAFFLGLAAVSAVNMFVITAVETMMPPEVENPWTSLYRRFLQGDFPSIAWPSHHTQKPSWTEIQNSTFSLGKFLWPGRGHSSLLLLFIFLVLFAVVRYCLFVVSKRKQFKR